MDRSMYQVECIKCGYTAAIDGRYPAKAPHGPDRCRGQLVAVVPPASDHAASITTETTE